MTEELSTPVKKGLERVNKSIKDQLWEKGIRLQCAKIRFSTFLNCWISLDKDPCPECKTEKCLNHGKKFFHQKRLMILGEA